SSRRRHTRFSRDWSSDVCSSDLIGQPAQGLLGAAQVEEELALSLGRGNLDDAPVAQDELVHLRLDPMDGEGNQTHTDVRVEAFRSEERRVGKSVEVGGRSTGKQQ